jgi:hypothetical protein
VINKYFGTVLCYTFFPFALLNGHFYPEQIGRDFETLNPLLTSPLARNLLPKSPLCYLHLPECPFLPGTFLWGGFEGVGVKELSQENPSHPQTVSEIWVITQKSFRNAGVEPDPEFEWWQPRTVYSVWVMIPKTGCHKIYYFHPTPRTELIYLKSLMLHILQWYVTSVIKV